MKKDLTSIRDLTKDEVESIFELAEDLKGNGDKGQPLKGKTLGMIFEKPSLRTRVTFETGMTQLGGHGIFLSPADIQLGRRESIQDAARNLSLWVDGVVARTFSHQTVLDLATHATIPVINGLSDLEHPCQAMADFFTIKEKKGFKDLKFAYIGDGNNVCHSLLLLGAKLGVSMSVATPKGYEPKGEVLKVAKEEAKRNNSYINVRNDPKEAVKDSDIIYTDVWASMGQEEEKKKRKEAFKPYQVNEKLLEEANKGFLVMHCLPAHRGEEITDEVIDGPNSIVLDQAENRLHIQKAILIKLIGGFR